MDWWTKLKRIMGVPEEDFIEDEPVEEYEEPENKRKSFFESRAQESSRPQPESRTAPRREPRHADRDAQYMNINATAQLQVVLVKPDSFQEAPQIADHLKDRKTVLLNLEGVDRETVRRLIDFLSGVAYSLGGKLKRVSNGTFIITPYDVDIMGDILDELKMERVAF